LQMPFMLWIRSDMLSTALEPAYTSDQYDHAITELPKPRSRSPEKPYKHSTTLVSGPYMLRGFYISQ
jgi:hypothetical protein